MDPQRLVPGDTTLIENIVSYLKAKGIFDDFRHECLADVDTKSSWQNLSQRVDGYTSKFLSSETYHPDLNKNELRNKLRQNISESWLLKVGADHVVEQVINPKIHQYFLPKIIEVVHQYIKEQNELSSKKSETTSADSASTSTSERAVYEISDSKAKTSISDPIADILSFGYSKSKPTPSTGTHVKTENVLQKPTDLPKLEKKKEEKLNSLFEKSCPEMPSEATIETKSFVDKEREKIKKEEPENSQDASKKVVKEEIKIEKKKMEDTKPQICEISCSVEENKASKDTSVKPSISEKKDIDKNKQKIKSSSMQKSSNSSYEVKKYKKESSDKPSDKHTKNKSTKSLKESTSPTKNTSCTKSLSKEEKFGESSKSKSSDSSSSKTSDSSTKKFSKSSNSKKDSSSKHKAQVEKIDKSKSSKSAEKSDPHDSSNSEKGMKTIQYSSSYDSSQGSDQDKSSSSSSKKERPKHFSKFAKKDKSEHSDKSDKSSSDKKRSKDLDEGLAKKQKHEKISKLKDSTVVEAAKISSRSNSFGSTSSISSSSNASKDNLVLNSDEVSESSVKDKKKKQIKEKDSCQNSDVTLPPPPPPPPTSGSLSFELTSSAEMSSVEDTQSSSEGEISSSEDVSEDPLSDLESESKEFEQSTLNESLLNSVTEEQNSFLEKIFLSSSSSEFEGFESSPEKVPVYDSDVSVSSVHTSDLSSFDDELSDDDLSLNHLGVKKRLTLKEAEELIRNRADILENCKNSASENQSKSAMASLSEDGTHSSSSFLSSLESSPEKNKTKETLSQDSDVTVSSVHTSDLSSFDDELSDEEFCLKNLGVKKRLTLKEAQELIQSKTVSHDKRKKSPKENKPESSKNSPNANESDSSKTMSTRDRSDSVSTSFKEKSSEKSSFLSSDEESSPSEPKRSLRRERKLNPRYASSEYTSIFNCKKESFITKQSSPSVKSHSVNSSPNAGPKTPKKESSSEKSPKKKSPTRKSVEAKAGAGCEEEVEHSEKAKNMLHNSKFLEEGKDCSNNSNMLSSEEIDSIMDKERVFEINTRPADNSDMKIHLKLKLQNNSNLNRNSLKRKLAVTESTPVKRPCSRNSVDSTSSEWIPNENKPFNNEKQSLVDEKILRDSNMKGSDFTDGIKKDLFCKQRINNNGDVLGQKDIFSKNSHGKNPHSNSAEKKATESDTSKELNAL